MDNPTDPAQGGDQNQQPGGMGGGMPVDPNAGMPAGDANTPPAPAPEPTPEPEPQPEQPAGEQPGGTGGDSGQNPGGETPMGGAPVV